jgi:CRP-like cAMP-binding protein
LPVFKNHLLRSLPQSLIRKIVPHLVKVDLKYATVIAEPNQRLLHAYFPESGIVSFVVQLKEGKMIETGMVGRDGVVGVIQALDDKVSLNKIVVQAPGVAYLIDADNLRSIFLESSDLRILLARHEQYFLAQVQQSVACNASHAVQPRLCRWLLRMYDLVGGELPVTQEFLAEMIGVRRTSVSEVAIPLQDAGLINYTRGKISILDRDGLKNRSCECYDAVRLHHDALFKE